MMYKSWLEVGIQLYLADLFSFKHTNSILSHANFHSNNIGDPSSGLA